MALTASFTDYPISGTPVSLDFHVVVEFSSAIDPTTLVGSDFRLRSQLATFHNPSNSQVDFYTDDNITFLVVFHFTGNLGGSQQYLVRLPMNRIQYEDEDGVTQNGPDSTINTPLFNIDPDQELSADITFADSEGEAGTATTATILFNQPVSGVSLSDFSVADGTLGSTLTEVNSGRYEVDVTPDSAGDGTLTLSFAADGTYEGNPEVTADLTYTGSGESLSTPSAPLNLTATAQSNGTSVILDWDVPSDDGGASVSDYEYSSNDGSTFTAIGSTDTDYTVTGLSKNTEYDFQVRAVNSQGSGTATASVTETTEATTPNAPTGLSVTVGETTADLSWTAPSDDGGESISSYEVSSDDGSTWTDTGDADLSYEITGLTAETEYDFKVRAVNSEGSGTASSTVTDTTTAAAVTPTLGWEVPSEAVGNTFSATLTSNVALDAAPTVGELRLRDDDNSDPIVSLTSSNTTITAITGTNNYLIEVELTGTYDDDYTIRINGNTVEYNGAYVNSAQLASAVFSIDSSIGANNAPSFSESSYSFTDIAIAVGTVVGTVAATDADNDTLSYSLTGTDASDFAIDSDGEITVATELTHSDIYNFNVVADDDTDTTSVAVTVTAIAALTAVLPDKVAGIGVTALSRSLRFVWDAPDAGDASIQEYEYQLDGGTWTSTGSDIPEFVIDELDNGTEYSVRLRARTASGVGQASEAVTATPAWPTPREGCYLLDLVESDFTGYTAPQLTTTETTLDADLGEDVNVGLIRIQTDTETDITSVVVQGSPDGDTQYVHLGEIEIGAGEYHAIRLNDRSVQALRLMVKTVSTPANLHTIEVYAVRVDLSSNVAGFGAEELQLGQNSYRRYDGVLVTSDGLRTVPRVELSLAQLTTAQTDGLTALMGEADFYLLAGLDDRYRVSIATDALRFTGRRGAHSLSLSLAGAVDLNNFTLAIEMEGQDISHLWIPEDGITVRRSIDTPQLNTVTTDTLTFSLDNEDFDFELNQPNNFFLRQGLNRHGRGAQVLIEINDTPVFAGFVWRVQSDLQSSRVQVQVVDMFAYMAQAEIQDLGEPLDLEITFFPGALDLYTTEDPVFPFPLFALPIVTGSVSATMSEDGATVDVEVVEVINTEGDLSPRRAEVDHGRGLLRFEAPPLDGQPTTITAQWKIALQYKRIDTLIRRVLENTGIMDRIGITPTSVRGFSIEQIPILLSENRFSSHGRPYPSDLGITRWMKHDPDADKWLMSIDTRLVEYDEYQDDYTELATIPEDTAVEDVPPGDYGTLAPDLAISVSGGGAPFVFYQNLIYRPSTTEGAIAIDRDTGQTVDNGINFDGGIAPNNIAIFDGELYLIQQTGRSCHVYNLRTGNFSRSFTIDNIFVAGNYWVSITPDYIYVSSGTTSAKRTLEAHDHEGNEVVSANIELGDITISREVGDGDDVTNAGGSLRGFVVTNRVYVIYDNAHNTSTTQFGPRDRIVVFDLSGNEIHRLQVRVSIGSNPGGLQIEDGFYYIYQGGTYHAFQSVQNLNYQGFVGYQLDTVDFDNIFIMATNTVHGDLLTDTTFNQNRLYRYVISTDTWTTLLDTDKGQPQLGMQYDFISENRILADNRKNFKVLTDDGKTLVFYRRAQSGSAQVTMYNVTDDVLTDIYSEDYDGSDFKGLPYSMDFVLDEKTNSIDLFTFVVTFEFSSGDFDEATLKIYKRQVRPTLGTESEVFTETFSSTDDDDVYPLSVSDAILADDRSKFYFVLDYQSEAEAVGKAELCEIAKDGSGSRTVLKTYDNPLLSARSPVKLGSNLFLPRGRLGAAA